MNGALHVYLGNADGTFTSAAAPLSSATNYSAVALGDLNGDGRLNLIVGGNVAATSVIAGTPNLYTLLGKGDGTFYPAQVTALTGTDGIGAQTIALGDFNGAGRMSIAIGNSNDFTEMVLGPGEEPFGFTIERGGVRHGVLALGQKPTVMGAVDLNGDGRPDLLI